MFVTFLWCPLKTTAKAPCPIRSFLLYTNSPTCSAISEKNCCLQEGGIIRQFHFVWEISGVRLGRKRSRFIAEEEWFARTLSSFRETIQQHNCYPSSIATFWVLSHRRSFLSSTKSVCFVFVRWMHFISPRKTKSAEWRHSEGGH